jgi:hypothetical protein
MSERIQFCAAISRDRTSTVGHLLGLIVLADLLAKAPPCDLNLAGER